MSWPTPQDYNEAVQNPHINFADDELRTCQVAVNAMGLPRVASGAFASVYRVSGAHRDVAVRCFLHQVTGQHERYKEISKYVMDDQLPATVAFNYLPDGISIHGTWYPILKMEWVQGESLDAYVRTHRNDAAVVTKLMDSFREMTLALVDAGIAHGDLQHGNIMVLPDGQIRLVDYDGMFVPALKGQPSNELGHRNYQHPWRTANHFDSRLDNFAAWSIYCSLLCLTKDPTLFEVLNAGDECLLFRQADYQTPTRSRAFAILEGHDDSEVRQCAKFLRGLLSRRVEQVPSLESLEFDTTGIGPLLHVVETVSEILNPMLPDWLQSHAPAVPVASRNPQQALLAFRQPPPTAWPNLDHYKAMVCAPASYFDDPELKNAQPARTADGALCYVQGPESVVFRMIGLSREIALKLYLKDDPERAMHYTEVGEYVQQAKTKSAQVGQYFVEFNYLPQALKFLGKRYPVLKMDWVDGEPLESAIGWRGRNDKCAAVMHEFRRMVTVIGNAFITHGDLSPSNVLWTGDGLKLVDYDNLQTPGMSQRKTRTKRPELCHPQSHGPVFPYDDYYASWIIDSALYVGSIEAPSERVEPSTFLSSATDLCDTRKLRELIGCGYSGIIRRAQLLDTLTMIDLTEVPKLNMHATVKNQFADKYGLTFPAFSPTHVSTDSGTALVTTDRSNVLILTSSFNGWKSLRNPPLHKSEYVVTTIILIAAVAFSYQYHFWMMMYTTLAGLVMHELWTPRKDP